MSEIKVDTVAEKTSANGVTIDGLNIKDSKLVTANSVIETNLTDNIVTLAKMASGTDGNIISYDASGNPVAIATGSDGQVLTSTGAGSPPAFEAAPSGGMTLLTSGDITSTTSTFTIGSTYVNDTYEHYQLWLRGKDAGDGIQMNMRFRNDADNANIDSGYSWRIGEIADNGGGTNATSGSEIRLTYNHPGNAANEGFNMVLDFMSPRSNLVPTACHWKIALANSSDSFQANHGAARRNDGTEKHSGFIVFFSNGGDFANGTNYEFYGLKK